MFDDRYNETIDYAEGWSTSIQPFHASWRFWCFNIDVAVPGKGLQLQSNDGITSSKSVSNKIVSAGQRYRLSLIRAFARSVVCQSLKVFRCHRAANTLFSVPSRSG
jgi:hypothetical protein